MPFRQPTLSQNHLPLSFTLSDVREEDYIDENMKAGVLDLREQEAYILRAFFKSYLITDLLSLCLNMCVQLFKG